MWNITSTVKFEDDVYNNAKYDTRFWTLKLSSGKISVCQVWFTCYTDGKVATYITLQFRVFLQLSQKTETYDELNYKDAFIGIYLILTIGRWTLYLNYISTICS